LQDVDQVEKGSESFPIVVEDECRSIYVWNHKFSQQNHNEKDLSGTLTEAAIRARDGHQISCVDPIPARVEDGAIAEYCPTIRWKEPPQKKPKREAAPGVPEVPKVEVMEETFNIKFSELVLLDRIGSGAYSEVLKARYRGVIVAVKKPLKSEEKYLQMFNKELNLLIKLQHPNVVMIIGACTNPPHLIMEFLPLSLTTILRQGPLTFARIVIIAKGISLGLHHLHTRTPKIIHTDLKPGNILLDELYNAKIADFGISRGITGAISRIGTPNYCAPEVLLAQRYSETADVYSFGMVLWEMMAGKVPFSGMGPSGEDLIDVQVIAKVVVEKARPQIPENWNTTLKQLISACWQQNAQERPTFEFIIKKLQEITS